MKFRVQAEDCFGGYVALKYDEERAESIFFSEL
jgi:hypothetical protein